MVYSILTEARIKGSVADLSPTERAYSTFWTTNGDLEGWTTILDLDIVGVWNGFIFGTKREATTGSIGPTDAFVPVDARVNERIFLRLKYDKHPKNTNVTNTGKIQFTTVSDPIFNDLKSVEFEVFPDGKWHFYEINTGEVQTWVGEINNVRVFPCINGARNDEFFLNFFEIGTNNFTFSFDNDRAGRPGTAIGGQTVAGAIEIRKDSNDKLIVNIDDYGDVQITLTPQTAPPEIIARDVSLQLGKVGIGGYIRSECFVDQDTNRMIIESGIRASDSSVVVKGGVTSAGFDLGFLDILGNFIGNTTAGSDPNTFYEPLSAYRPTTLEILALFDNDIVLPAFTIDPQSYVVEGGRRDYGLTNKKIIHEAVTEANFQGERVQVIGGFADGLNNTLIDLTHPFTDDGEVEKVFINGIVGSTSGNTKWKIFRPKLDGTLTLVAEGPIGVTPTLGANEVITAEPGVYSVDISTQDVRVRRGDLLGVFNTQLHVGDFGGSKVDALYYQFSGDITGTVTPPTPGGAGEAGLPIYARGRTTKNKAVVDIDLQKRLNLDTIRINGFEDTRDLEYNIAIATSATFSVDVPGNHEICYNISPTSDIRVCINRNNAAFNIAALNDDIIYAENGVAGFGSGGPGGAGGADADGATYFYVNGDGEFLGTQEFVSLNPARGGFFRDAYGIDCFFSSTSPRLDKPIGKVVIFFKDKKNQRSWQLETSLGDGSKGGNGSKAGFQLIPAESIQAIEFDNRRFESVKGFVTTKNASATAEILIDNPVILDTIAADGTRNPQRGVDFTNSAGELGGVNTREQVTFFKFQWNRYQWDFDTLRTIALRYYSDYHFSTKISEFQIFGVSESQESLGDNSQILFSADGEAFTTAALLRSSESEADYKLGASPQFLRLIFRPTLQLSISDVKVEFEEDQICFGEEGRILGAIDIPDSRVGTTGEAFPLLITNSTGQEADLILDIPSDINSAKQLLYFSKLHNANDIIRPQVGPPGRIDFTSDKILKEEENIAQNAHCYGLLSLVSGTASTFQSNNLLINAGFEQGNLTGWDLVVIQSGTGITNSGTYFGVPSVRNVEVAPDEANIADSGFQSGSYCFGAEIDTRIPEHGVVVADDFENIEFELSQTVDLTEYGNQIDVGSAIAHLQFRYITYFSGSGPTVRFIGGRTEEEAKLPTGTVISGYGNNLLRSTNLARSTSLGNPSSPFANLTTELQTRLPVDTRFLRVEVDCGMTNGVTDNFSTFRLMQFWTDEWELNVVLPTPTTAKWYKSWRTGVAATDEFDGWTDSSFVPIPQADYVTTTGSTHWHQPFDSGNTTGIPTGSQPVGFSNVFRQDTRFSGIMSFRQMTITDPGIIGSQWESERDLAGFLIAVHHETSNDAFFAESWPIMFQVEVLRTKSELGEDPDLNNTNHFKEVAKWRSLDARQAPSTFKGSSSSSGAPWSRVSTFLFPDGPISTQGMRIMFTRNCDIFERATHANSSAFSALTGCPADNQFFGFNWISRYGLGASYFVPLEALNRSDLPLNNVREFQKPGSGSQNTGPVYAAVDLGRHRNVELDSTLYELVSSTKTQSQWNVGSALFSSSNTDDPNQVVWAGGSSNARWIRFTDLGSDEFEDEALYEITGSSSSSVLTVDEIPQGTINQARLYPNLSTTLFPTEGYNADWVDLGTILSDNKTSTFIYGSDYPVIAFDLGKEYILANDTDLVRKRHEPVGPNPDTSTGSTDKKYWEGNSETNWTYSVDPSSHTSRPETVPFRAWGAGVPDFPVRWVATKIAFPLQVFPSGDPPKTYNFQTPGLALFYVTIKPRNPEIFTENAQWFSNKKAVLRDISTFVTTIGKPIIYTDGIDYGSAAGVTGNSSTTTANNIGDPYLAFDGQFDEFGLQFEGVWGVELRDIVTGRTDSNNAFPHSIWRVFRNPQTEVVETKAVKAVYIRGYNESFYPTTFRIQSLKEDSSGNALDPNRNSSWTTAANASFSNVDTFQEGFGFTHIFTDAVETKGIRIRIANSVYVDDSQVTSTDPDTGTNKATLADVSGPQTRVAEIIIYEEAVEDTVIVGTIETNHMVSATVTSATFTPDHEPFRVTDEDLDTYWQSTGFTDSLSITLPRPAPITRLEWELDKNFQAQSAQVSTNGPYNFSLRGIVDGIEQTLVVGSGIEGTFFSQDLEGGPITAKDFTFEVTDVQGRQEEANSIIINELRLLEIEERTAPLTVIESSQDRRPGSINKLSTKITYAANADAIAKVTADGWDGNNDESFSERDFFSIWVFINDVSLLDTSFGNFKLGNDSDTYYRWDFKNLNLTSGWQNLFLQFSEADSKSEIPFKPGYQFDLFTGESRVDFVTADITVTSNVDGNFSRRVVQSPGVRFFETEFRGTDGPDELEIILDDFRFIRNRFDDTCHFAPSLYLNNSEAFTIFLEGLDLATGTVEFWFQPDWDTSGRIQKDRAVIASLFKIMRPDGKFLSFFYRPNQGLIPMIFDGEQLLQFVTSVGQYRFERFDTFHVALVWDAERRVRGPRGENASLALYINGELVYGSDITWNAVRESGATVMFGGEVGQKLAATPDNAVSQVFTPVVTQPAKNTASTWGLIENLKMYNYPKSTFDDIYSPDISRTQLLTPAEMIQISVSGTGPFVGAGSDQLPLVVQNVAAGGSVTAYIRTNIPKGLTGDENRDASLLVRWKTPLKECD